MIERRRLADMVVGASVVLAALYAAGFLFPIFHVPQVLLFGVAAWLADQVLFT